MNTQVQPGAAVQMCMTVDETVKALAEIGLIALVQTTGHADYVRVFALDEGVTHGRLTVHRGIYSHAKWYVSAVDGGSVLDDERIPWAWRLWLERRERLDVTKWRMAVSRAKADALAERAEKQALRDAMPARNRRRLQLNVRRHLARILLGGADA